MWISQRPVVINNQTADEQLTDKVENLDKWIAILPDITKNRIFHSKYMPYQEE